MAFMEIDGSMGEGGGQVLRTALALSAVTGKPFCASRIRAGREKPGILRQHLAAARVAAQVCGARVEGDEIGSQELKFEPGPVKRGVSAEHVAKEAVEEAREYIASGAAVGRHLADQILIPFALAGSGSFVTVEPTMHTTTNAQVIGMFLDARIETADLGEGRWEIAARKPAAG